MEDTIKLKIRKVGYKVFKLRWKRLAQVHHVADSAGDSRFPGTVVQQGPGVSALAVREDIPLPACNLTAQEDTCEYYIQNI